jgi:ATP-dependent DNA ligase
MDPRKNHLAVRSEDHSLEYAGFSGEIREGEYGAGRVVIWDRGRYECEKWTGCPMCNDASCWNLWSCVARTGTPRRTAGVVAKALADSKRQGLEGVVAKRLDSVYEPGRRSRAGTKVKNVTTQEVVMLDDLQRRLHRLERKTPPFAGLLPGRDIRDAHWVTPKLVGEVGFSEWTRDGRLRQPTWRGLRPDKSPDEVVRES